MANMSYCRFENTAIDLNDCGEHFEDDIAELSDRERKARMMLLVMCSRIASEFEDEVEEYREQQRAKRQAAASTPKRTQER